jgi:hypothetical protein
MNAQTIIGERVEGGWKPTSRLLAHWRRRPPLLPQTVFADEERLPTPAFRALWLASRASGLSLSEPIVTEDGKPTDYLRRIW